jgi:Nif-specific regulatory protein
LNYIGLALIHYTQGHHEQANKYLKKALSNVKDIDNMEYYIKTEFYIKISQLYYEMMDYESSMNFATRLTGIAPSTSRDYTVGAAFVKLCQHKTNPSSTIDIEDECIHLKNMGCIYDYAFLRKLEAESFLDNSVAPNMLKIIAERLTEVLDIFKKLGAGLELQRVKQLEERLYPMIIREYSKRAISTEYLDTFSRLAELVSNRLGDEDFLQDILDLLIQTTGAERGALFIKTVSDTMEFAAGRNMDKTTIDDAGQLSLTAIREMDRNNIIFTEDALVDPEFNIKKSVILHHIHSLLCIPLLVSNNVIGALYLDSRLGTSIFGPEDKGFLLAVARILASVIEKSLAFKTMTEENILLKSKMIQEIGSGYLVGKSRAMKQVYHLIDNVAKSISPVVLLGETGTGKGMLARLIHIRSERKQTKFLTINCGTIPETLLESELFGHKRGSFTGAVSDKKGLLEEGEGGTVFLDEITNTSLAFQAKLLEAIEEKIIRRLGETTTRQIDVRFLFATNRNLEIEVEDGRFRQDLFYRINVFNVEVPPLRERVNDITVLAKYFLDRYSKEINKKVTGFTPDALQKLKDYYWPGNVRELQNVIERAVVLTKSDLISVEDLGFETAKGESIIPLKEIKKEAVLEALTATGWNVKRAAELLQIGRKSIYRYMKKFNISRKAWGT